VPWRLVNIHIISESRESLAQMEQNNGLIMHTELTTILISVDLFITSGFTTVEERPFSTVHRMY